MRPPPTHTHPPPLLMRRARWARRARSSEHALSNQGKTPERKEGLAEDEGPESRRRDHQVIWTKSR